MNGKEDGHRDAAQTVRDIAAQMESKSEDLCPSAVHRIWVIEAVDGSIVQPEWYESERDAREAAPSLTALGDEWESCWTISSFTREIKR